MAQFGNVPASWFGITRVMSAEPHLALLEEVDRRGINHNDLDAVENVWLELIQQAAMRISELAERAEVRRAEISKDNQELLRIRTRFPIGALKRG
jgi:hypothetical protein